VRRVGQSIQLFKFEFQLHKFIFVIEFIQHLKLQFELKQHFQLQLEQLFQLHQFQLIRRHSRRCGGQ